MYAGMMSRMMASSVRARNKFQSISVLKSATVSGQLGFTSGTTSPSLDAFFSRDSAANIQMGADSATAVNQTFKSCDGLGTDKVGANLTVNGGQGTGTGRGGDLVYQTAPSGTTGSVANAYSTRKYVSAKEVDLTEATATQIASITIASGKYLDVTITATVFASDGTDHQTLGSDIRVTAVNKAGTLTVSAVTQTNVGVCNSSGTLTPVTYTAVASGANLVIKCAATSSLAQTILRCSWQIRSINSNDPATVTPS